jgi:crotonobetainyl-CoA:carnitine CoA-transferase CaiB-like acyl-CoA transferase
MAVLAALQQRVRGKVTDLLDVNLFAGVLMLQQVPLSGYLTTGDLPRRCGSGAPCSAPNEAYETADGHILIAAHQNERWQRLCLRLGRPELAHDSRFVSLKDRMSNRSRIREEGTRMTPGMSAKAFKLRSTRLHRERPRYSMQAMKLNAVPWNARSEGYR